MNPMIPYRLRFPAQLHQSLMSLHHPNSITIIQFPLFENNTFTGHPPCRYTCPVNSSKDVLNSSHRYMEKNPFGGWLMAWGWVWFGGWGMVVDSSILYWCYNCDSKSLKQPFYAMFVTKCYKSVKCCYKVLQIVKKKC